MERHLNNLKTKPRNDKVKKLSVDLSSFKVTFTYEALVPAHCPCNKEKKVMFNKNDLRDT